LQKIFDLCEFCSKLDYNNISDEDKKEKNTLIAVVLGCLHNITNENGIFLKNTLVVYSSRKYFKLLILILNRNSTKSSIRFKLHEIFKRANTLFETL
jgi:endo-1,4-beta-D-glucanase Y